MATLLNASVLLVEDDAHLARWVGDYLRDNGYVVTHLDRGDKVMDWLTTNTADLILLDIMLPGMDGFDVCKAVRAISQTPIIMMTAKSEEFDEVLGLELGANDYVVKPIKPRALLARVRGQLRTSQTERSEDDANGDLTFGQLTISHSSRRVVLNGEEINLSNGLFSLLWLLASHAGEEISRDDVFQHILGREYDGVDRRFDVMVSSLRKALRDNPQHPERIKTVWGKGYLFVPDSWETADENEA